MRFTTPVNLGAIAVYTLAIIAAFVIFDPRHPYAALALGLSTGAIVYHTRARSWIDRFFLFHERDITLRQALLAMIMFSLFYMCLWVVNEVGGSNYTGESLLFLTALLLAIEVTRLASRGR
jgi:hypothetical protein